MSYNEYIKNSEDYAYDNFIDGATISDIVEELTYIANRYGVDYVEITIYDLDDEEETTVYYAVVNIQVNYKFVEMV